MAEPSLQTLVSAGNALLRPPDPLPSAPQQLLARLRDSSSLLSWTDRPGWTADDELDEIGDDNSDDLVKRRARRDQLVLLVGQRCLDLIVAAQSILVKEFWPAEHREGLGEKDFLLGTADLRLLRLMFQHAVVSFLLPLTLAYVAGLSQGRNAELDSRLPVALHAFLSLTESQSPPSGSSTAHAPVTVVTQTLVTSHLPAILLATITVAWTPTVPPARHAALRSRLMAALSTLSPTQAMAVLSGALKIVQGGKRRPPKGWTRTWPSYVEGAIGTLLSSQVLKPGGVKAVMENVFGEAANMAGPEAVEGPKLDQISSLLCRVPKTTTAEAYIPYLLSTLMDLIAPESNAHPMVYTHTAAYVVHHLWSTSSLAKQWLEQRLHSPWLPDQPEPGVVMGPAELEEIVRTSAQLVLHAPPSSEFTDFVVGPILPPLFALHVALTPAVSSKAIEKQAAAPASGLAHDVQLLLSSWGKIVVKEDGVRGIWTLVTGGRGWPASEDGEVLQWQKGPEGMELAYGPPILQVPEADPASMDVDDAELIDQIDLSPNPQNLAQLLKTLGRFDVASEIFLKVLDEWRVRANADDQDPLQTLLYLRLTVAMMDALDHTKLLADPSHVLTFVEGVLSDEVQALPKAEDVKAPLVQEVGLESQDAQLPELSAEGIEKMGMVETAISLLLASLEANEKLNHTTAAILHPINAHLEALSERGPAQVRPLAREAILVLLIRRSASLTTEKQTSEAVSTYRRALNLIADPILPVRAHGLVLLRDLVLSPNYDPALTPSILDVYTQALQDSDSYIYLNAVKGLASMADALGRDIFRTLVRLYRTSEMDKSLRLGEALGLIIKRAGSAFSANAELIIPTLLSMVRDSSLPTIQRVSALSLLSTAAESHLALLPWSQDLASAAIDLIQVESVAGSSSRPKPEPKTEPQRRLVTLIDDEEPEPEPEPEPEDTQPPRTIDEDPISQNSKHPALRRAGIVFLGLLLASIIDANNQESDSDSAIKTRDDSEFTLRLPGDMRQEKGRNEQQFLDESTLSRAANVLGYVARTDVDEVARGQAGEVVGLIERVREIMAVPAVSRTLL